MPSFVWRLSSKSYTEIDARTLGSVWCVSFSGHLYSFACILLVCSERGANLPRLSGLLRQTRCPFGSGSAQPASSHDRPSSQLVNSQSSGCARASVNACSSVHPLRGSRLRKKSMQRSTEVCIAFCRSASVAPSVRLKSTS